jgi:anti-sigma regulatory factor (Ser/Thr protein kinase)
MSLCDQISLKPTASDVSRLNTWLDLKFAEGGVNANVAADLKLCLNEVAANLISYGLRGVEDPSILIMIEVAPTCASATVCDNGAYFDIRTWLPRVRNLTNDEPGGFGILLIKERAAHMEYRSSCGLNRLRIICRSATP